MSMSTGVMGMLGLGLGAASTASQSYYAYQQAKAQNLAAEWNASIMESNAQLADIRAEQALERGEHNVALAKIQGTQQLESMRGAYAASGVKVDSGSALDTVAQQAGFNKYDQDMLKYNAELEAWGIRSDAANLRTQAQMTRATKQSPWTAATTTALSGTTNLFNQYRQYSLTY